MHKKPTISSRSNFSSATKGLTDILPADNLEMYHSIASRLQATDGKNVLFIFDGWDEFPSNLMKKSIVSTIIQQPYEFLLPQRTVLITSRPVASGNLLHIANQRVEILGFTQQQIHGYIEKALNGNSTRIQKLIQHLEEHPVIEGYCYIPLHSAILVHLFLTMKGALPTTLHELFCSLVLCCIVREHATHEPDISLPELSSLDDLPDDLKSKLNNHCILAYNGVKQDKVVFYSKDLQKSKLPFDISSLGLLQAVEGLTLTSKSLSYNFLHLSVQELLAAYRISQMPPSEQVKVFKNLFENSRFQPVLHFYCGFTKLDNSEIQEFISYRQHRNSNLKKLLPFLHCFFEAQQPSLCQLVDPEFTTDIKLDFADIRNPSDYIAIGYFITSLLSMSTADMPPVRLSIQCKYTDNLHCLKLLLSELSKYPAREQPTACALSRKLIFLLGTESNDDRPVNYNWLVNDRDEDEPYEPSITGKGAKLIANHLKISPAISKLVLYQGEIQWDEDGLFHIAEALRTNTSLTELSLVNVNPKHTEENGSALVKMLRLNKSLEYLNLSCDFLESAIHCCIFEGLRHNTTLTHLILHRTHLQVSDPDTARSLTVMLQENRSITYLDLSKNRAIFSQKGGCCIFIGLQHNTALTHLFLEDYITYQSADPDTVRSLNLMLQVNKSLTHLDLSESTNFTESGARCIFEGLQHNTNLLQLNLSSTGITATDPDTARSLTKMLQMNKSLTHLDLSSNETFSDSGARCIFKGLLYNSSLICLNISNTGMTATDPDTATYLTKMLEENKSLTHLDLSSNGSRYCKNAIILHTFLGLKHNTTLLGLDISNNIIITDSDAECIAQAMSCNHSLQTLNMYSHSYTSERSIRCILDALRFNTSLNLLCLFSLEIEEVVKDFKIARNNSGLPPIDIVLTP